MQSLIVDILTFSKKPKLKVGNIVKEIATDDGHYKYSKDVFVKKIEKQNNKYKVYVGE